MQLVLLSLLALASTPLVLTETGSIENIQLCNSIFCPQVLCPPYECQGIPEGECCPQCGPKVCPDCSLLKCPEVLCPAGTCKNPNKCCGTLDDCSPKFCKPTIDCSTVLCAFPGICPDGQCLGIPEGECCPKCSAKFCKPTVDCSLVKCAASPKECPKGQCLGTPKGKCCPECRADLCPYCSNVICPDVLCPPGTCKNPADCCVNPRRCKASFC